VTVHGHPETFNGDYSDQVTGYWLFPSGLDPSQAPGLQFDTIRNTSYRTDATLTLERISAGASDNDITTAGYSIVDAGAGDDTVTADFSPDWRYNQEFQVSPWYYDRPYDPRNLGALLDGNAGDDRLTGSAADDVLIGGDGDDFMNGGAGSDTYVVTAGVAGWDTIADSGGQAWSPETFSTRYQDWYYQSQGIADWRERRDRGETLPDLPAIAINDFASGAPLASAGIIATDSVEFGEGITSADLTLSWGEYVPYDSSEASGTVNPSEPDHWMDPGSVHTTLDISWAAGSGVRIVMPHSSSLDSPISPEVLNYAPYPDVLSRDDWYLGQGIETFRFADGSQLSMQGMLALAPPPPTLDPHLRDNRIAGTAAADVLVGAAGNDTLGGGAGYDTYVFNPGDGVDTITDAVLNGEANRIRFGSGILPGDISVSWTAEGITLHTGSSGDAIKLVNSEPGGDPSVIIDRLLFTLPGDESGTPEPVSRLFADFLPAGGGGTPGIEVTGTSRHNTLTGTPGDDVLEALAGNDRVNAGAGDDRIDGGPGRDVLNGEGGNDTFLVEGSDRAFDIFNGGEGRDTIQGGDGDDTIRVRRFDAGNSVEVIDGGAGVNLIAGTRGRDIIDLSTTTVRNIDHIDAGAGNDSVTGTGGDDRIIGGAGRDVLNGGPGDDLYRFDRHDGRDLILDADPAPNHDRIGFGEAIRHDQLWFNRVGNDLTIELIGTRDEVTVQNWYASTDNQIEALQSGDGYTLLNTQVDQLVQAMAAFSPPASGELDLPPRLQSQLEPALAANWQAS
jgi:Ca2+-binding RTX toxin-like protein